MAPDNKKSILIVDDSATVRKQMVSMLEQEFRCLTAESGNEAMEALVQELPDAIVTDLDMPQMGGIDLLRALRSNERTKSLPVLVTTTVTEVERVNECRQLGCSGFVLKPPEKEYLLAKLRRLTQTR